MTYEELPVSTKPSKTAVRKQVKHDIDGLDTSTIVWHLAKRHKFGLVTSYALVLSLFYFVPFLPDMLFGLIGR